MYDTVDYAIESYSSLLAWYTSIPGRMGGGIIYDVLAGRNGILKNMSIPFTSTSGWSTSTRPFSYGEWRFDEVDDYIQIPVILANRASYTIVCWVRDTGTFQDYIYQESNASGSHQISLVINEDVPGDIQFFILDDGVGGSGINVSGNSYNDNKWHHVAVSFTNIFAELFVDGKSIGTSSTATGTTTVDSAAIGARASGATGFFNGAIDDVRVYKSALKAVEINYLYERGRKEWPIELLRLIDNPYLGNIRDRQNG